MCGVESGRVQRCSSHLGRECSVCGSPAWRDCEHLSCEAVLCRSPACFAKHLQSAHEGNTPAEPTVSAAPTEPEIQVAEEADPCPVCDDPELSRVFVFESHQGTGGDVQVQCSGCGVAGPACKSSSLALTGWNRMPRGRPAVYESIRRRGLNIIARELESYEERGSLDAADCRAVAAMLESATMAVDTWSM